ncbi:MAG TPA: anthranilate synthase component I family protein, partial [bacterium]|nr:anthranilate synthase component I family protein [bacterium]
AYYLDTRSSADPFVQLECLIKQSSMTAPHTAANPTVLCLGYDLKNLIETLPMPKPSLQRVPDLYATDYWQNFSLRASRAGQLQDSILRCLSSSLTTDTCGADALQASMTRQQYIGAVRRSLDYIFAGDIYQVNIAQRFTFPFTGSSWELFKRLYCLNPAQFSLFIRAREFDLIVCSPERLLKRSGTVLETRPIKGTRPRGETPQRDRDNLRELLLSQKEKAELIMITDLHRNDLGKVSQYGMVNVVSKRHVHRMRNVFHTESIIRSVIRQDVSLSNLLKALFPGGSVTGCPKLRAIEIIDELEPQARQFYTGAVGIINSEDDLDMAMTIRCITFHRATGLAWFDIGSGIVAESDPESEYEETLDKAQSVFDVLGVKR